MNNESAHESWCRAAGRIRGARKSAAMTQAQLAQAMGVSAPYISLLESGRRNPANLREDTLSRLCGALGVTREQIIGDCERTIFIPSARLPDLSGQRFGMAVAVRRVPGGAHGLYECVCDCGVRFTARGSQLCCGDVTSCGCKRSGSGVEQSMIGRRFGRLTVVSRSDQKRGTNRLYLCACDCGNTCIVSAAHLRRGEVVSCGCYRDGLYEKMDSGVHAYDYAGTNISRIQNKSTLNKNNKSGVRGVCRDSRSGLWLATIGVGGEKRILGRFRDKQSAIDARLEGEKQYHDPLIASFSKVQSGRDAD